MGSAEDEQRATTDEPAQGRPRAWLVGVENAATGQFYVHASLDDEAQAQQLASWMGTDKAGVEVRPATASEEEQLGDAMISKCEEVRAENEHLRSILEGIKQTPDAQAIRQLETERDASRQVIDVLRADLADEQRYTAQLTGQLRTLSFEQGAARRHDHLLAVWKQLNEQLHAENAELKQALQATVRSPEALQAAGTFDAARLQMAETELAQVRQEVERLRLSRVVSCSHADHKEQVDALRADLAVSEQTLQRLRADMLEARLAAAHMWHASEHGLAREEVATWYAWLLPLLDERARARVEQHQHVRDRLLAERNDARGVVRTLLTYGIEGFRSENFDWISEEH